MRILPLVWSYVKVPINPLLSTLLRTTTSQWVWLHIAPRKRCRRNSEMLCLTLRSWKNYCSASRPYQFPEILFLNSKTRHLCKSSSRAEKNLGVMFDWLWISGRLPVFFSESSYICIDKDIEYDRFCSNWFRDSQWVPVQRVQRRSGDCPWRSDRGLFL